MSLTSCSCLSAVLTLSFIIRIDWHNGDIFGLCILHISLMTMTTIISRLLPTATVFYRISLEDRRTSLQSAVLSVEFQSCMREFVRMSATFDTAAQEWIERDSRQRCVYCTATEVQWNQSSSATVVETATSETCSDKKSITSICHRLSTHQSGGYRPRHCYR